MKTNFHTHTFRCGHAVGNEEAMVKSAIEEGIEVLGFSEHVPLPRYRKHIF
ncbi:PHP domain-containing protein, partial [Tyzzerella nexilis]|nr:PHP domain-containing protein [[Clostridium] nexile]